ncbi:hypothetical protein Tco_0415881 [Tanacetum coccineum]
MPFSTYLNLGLGELAHTKLTVELANRTVKYPKGIAENVLVSIGKFTFPIDFIILDMPEDIKVPLILGRPFLSTARTKIDVYKRKITLRIREERIIFTSVKLASILIKRVYMLKLNDLNESFKIRRNQGDDLMPTIKEGELIEEFRTSDEEFDAGIYDNPILENMDNYHDEKIGDVIFGEPFLREVRINAKRFEGMITIYNGNNEVTYQMDIGSKEISTNTGGEFTNMEILKCWSLETSRRLRHFKTLSLDELRSPDFNLLSDQEYSKEEVTETMAETMEQYMSKTQADYGSGVARTKIEDKDNFELKGQFLKELRTNTFSGSDHEDANEHIEKVLKIVDLFHITNITIDQVMLTTFPMSLTGAASHWLRNEPTGSITTWDEMQEVILFYNGLEIPTRQILVSRGAIPSKTTADEKIAIQEIAKYSQKWHNGTEIKKVNEKVYAAQVGCKQCKGPHYTKDCPLKEEWKTLEEAYYTQFGGLFQRGGYRVVAPRFYQRNNANPWYQERRQSMEDTLSKFMSESAKRDEENSNLIKEIRALTDATIRNQGASIKTLKIQIGQMSKSISTTIEADSYPIRRIRSSQYAVSTRQSRTLMYDTRQTTIPFLSRLNGYYYEEKKGSYRPQFSEAYSEASQSIPQKEKDLGSFTLPYFINNVCFDNALVDLGASVSVMPLSTYLNLGLGELAHTKLTVELVERIVKYPKRIAENVLVGIGKFIFPVDFINLDVPKDIKVPLILGRPFLSTACAKINVYKREITLRIGEERIVFTSVKPASSLIKRVYMLSLRERMELDLEARLMGDTLVLNRSLDPFLEDYIELNDLNEPFELRRNQGDDLMPTIKEGAVIKEFRTRDDELNVGIDDYPSYCDYDKKIHIDFLENMDAYRDEGMGDVIFGEPFLREVGIKAKRFEGIITIYNGDDEVTYQMVRSHLRFKCHTNEQCNKILPLLKVSEKDEMNGILHAYQKLKGFYKGVLNLGPDYI